MAIKGAKIKKKEIVIGTGKVEETLQETKQKVDSKVNAAEKKISKALAEKIADALSDKKGYDIDVIDTSKVTILADYFVICSGTSTTHIKSLADEVDFQLSKDGLEPLHREGYSTARWILLDYGSVIVHVFHEEERKFYSLERLWSDGTITRRD